MKAEYIEKIYAGWLAKIIGIRLGAPIEGWTYQRIQNVFEELHHYPKDFRQFAADDDSNGPIFLIRALENSKNGFDITAQDVGEALLNYAPFEKGFFWWGGYGTSTEHTAYLNLRSGIRAPQSGSIAQNGSTMAEQIGGQIFIDSWGLVTPGNPDLAAKYAALAASVTHDGNGVYGGIFIAVCISYAFVEQNIRSMIEKGLSYIPDGCEYTRVVRAVMDFHQEHPKDWRSCFQFVFQNFGYDKYPGNCHIIPNVAVIILALLYGNGDFSDTLNICNMCGWDTDCNVGNVATIMGVRGGLEVIDDEKWRKPINDILICSSVIGSLNISDIPYGAGYLAKLAAAIAKEKLEEPWDQILNRPLTGCHFEYPGSTHGMRVRTEEGEPDNYCLRNTTEAAFTGKRSLSMAVSKLQEGRVFLYRKTYYVPSDFDDSRYDPSFSPIVYPGQTITGKVYLPQDSQPCKVRAYVRNVLDGKIITDGEGIVLEREKWTDVSLKVPFLDSGLLDEAGFVFDVLCGAEKSQSLRVLLDDFYIEGTPDYSIQFAKSREDYWSPLRQEISQFTKLKGISYLVDGRLHLSCHDFGEMYTGGYDWEDYTAIFRVRPEQGAHHMVNVRVQGAIRSYAAGFTEQGKFGFCKNDHGYQVLEEVAYAWNLGEDYEIVVTVIGDQFIVSLNGKQMLQYTDLESPFLTGSIGISVAEGSHSSYESIQVHPM